MENIYAIVISDLHEKIHFLHKKANFNLELCLKITKTLNKSLHVNYLQEHISKGIENRLMDTMINARMKVKLSILGDVIIIMVYDANLDINYINHINQRMIEAFYV